MNALKDVSPHIEELRMKTDPKLTKFLVERFAAVSQKEYQRFLKEGPWQVNVCQINIKETGKPYYIENDEVFIFTGKDITDLERHFTEALGHLGKHWVFKRQEEYIPKIIAVDFKQGRIIGPILAEKVAVA